MWIYWVYDIIRECGANYEGGLAASLVTDCDVDGQLWNKNCGEQE